MTKVFIAGSRRLSRLNADVKRRIDTMIDKDFTILVGDANGADKAVQRYLAEKGYRNVIVHCMANNCRNNVAYWPTREVLPPKGARGFAYYAAKDQAMVDDAAYGLMLWDGESTERARAALDHVPVLRVSFAKVLDWVRASWLALTQFDDVLTNRQMETFFRRVYKHMGRCVTIPRRSRSYPRAVRQPVRPWPRLMHNESIKGPVHFKIL